jgi:hypothetical protein
VPIESGLACSDLIQQADRCSTSAARPALPQRACLRPLRRPVAATRRVSEANRFAGKDHGGSSETDFEASSFLSASDSRDPHSKEAAVIRDPSYKRFIQGQRLLANN